MPDDNKTLKCDHARDAAALLTAAHVPYLHENYPDKTEFLEDVAAEIRNSCECRK